MLPLLYLFLIIKLASLSVSGTSSTILDFTRKYPCENYQLIISSAKELSPEAPSKELLEIVWPLLYSNCDSLWSVTEKISTLVQSSSILPQDKTGQIESVLKGRTALLTGMDNDELGLAAYSSLSEAHLQFLPISALEELAKSKSPPPPKQVLKDYIRHLITFESKEQVGQFGSEIFKDSINEDNLDLLLPTIESYELPSQAEWLKQKLSSQDDTIIEFLPEISQYVKDTCSWCLEKVRGDGKDNFKLKYNCILACKGTWKPLEKTNDYLSDLDHRKELEKYLGLYLQVIERDEIKTSLFYNLASDYKFITWFILNNHPSEAKKKNIEILGKTCENFIIASVQLQSHVVLNELRYWVEALDKDSLMKESPANTFDSAILLAYVGKILRIGDEAKTWKDDFKRMICKGYFSLKLSSQLRMFPLETAKLFESIHGMLRETPGSGPEHEHENHYRSQQGLDCLKVPLSTPIEFKNDILLKDIATRWLMEIIRSPDSLPDEKLATIDLIIDQREEYHKHQPTDYLPRWVLGEFKSPSELVKIIEGGASFREISKKIMDGEISFWKSVIRLIISDYIASNADKMEEKGKIDFEQWNSLLEKAIVMKLDREKEEKGVRGDGENWSDLLGNSPYLMQESVDQGCPRGLASIRVVAEFAQPSTVDLSCPKPPLPKDLWPNVVERISANDYIQVLRLLDKYRAGKGVVNLAIRARERILGDISEVDWKEIWELAFRRVKSIQDIDLILSRIPSAYFNTISSLPSSSLGWTRLALMSNAFLPKYTDRESLGRQILNYLSLNSREAYSTQGLSILLLDSHTPKAKLEIFLKVAAIYREALNFEPLPRSHEILKKFLIEGLYLMESELRTSTNQKALEKYGRALFMRGKDEIQTLESAQNYIEFFTSDRKQAKLEEWTAALSLCRDGKFAQIKEKLITSLFSGMEISEWENLFKLFKPEEFEADLTRAGADFEINSASNLCSIIKKKVAEFTEDNVDCGDPAVMPLAGVRILDQISNPQRKECIVNLMEASTKISQLCIADKEDHNMATTPVNEIQRILNLKRLRNRAAIAAGLFIAHPTPPIGRSAVTSALQDQNVIKEAKFIEEFTKFVLTFIIPYPDNDENFYFIQKFEAMGTELANQSISAKYQTPFVKISLQLLDLMDYEKFALASKEFQTTHPEVPLNENDPKNVERSIKMFLKLLKLVLDNTEEELAKLLGKGAATSGGGSGNGSIMANNILFVDEPDSPIVCKSPRLTENDIIKSTNWNPPSECIHELLTYYHNLNGGGKFESSILAVPKVAKSINHIFTGEQLSKFPPEYFGLLTEDQIGKLGLEKDHKKDDDPCRILENEKIIRQLHLTGSLLAAKPKCLKQAKENWIFAFKPNLVEKDYPFKEELLKILDSRNFVNIDKEAIENVKIEPELWSKLGTELETGDLHPCSKVPKEMPDEFWKGITAECLLTNTTTATASDDGSNDGGNDDVSDNGSDKGASTFLERIPGEQLVKIPISTLKSIPGKELLKVSISKLPMLTKEYRMFYFKTARREFKNDQQEMERFREAVVQLKNLTLVYEFGMAKEDE